LTALTRHLSYLHKRFGKWYLAAIAYNCGGGKLNRAIKKAHTDKLSVLLDTKKRYIPKESRFYIRKIIALAFLGSDEQFLLHSEYEHLLNRANAYSIATVKLSSSGIYLLFQYFIQISLKLLQNYDTFFDLCLCYIYIGYIYINF